ncbi:MAG: M48 family metallopeptidase [Alphaproteobacteria bacterium]|jgi:predicted metal-dependent hydrolase|nr:M48 family metallopeptidase [Alphaproteobacteria bacterium]
MKIFNITIHDNTYALSIIKRKNAKRITLRLNLKTKQPVISIPYRETYETALDFFKKNYTWVEAQLAKTSSINQSNYFATLQEVSIYGNIYKIIKISAKKNKITINMDDRELYLEFKDLNDLSAIEKTFIKFLKKIATSYFYELSKYKAQQINTKFNNVGVGDTTSKWGSCSATKKLQYNYRLIMAPVFVIDYVVSHEVAHLIEFNHSDRFWRLLEQLTPYKKEAKLWLKNYGKSLY